MQCACLNWEVAKFCSFMKIRIVWLQISPSLSVAVQLYSTFRPMVKKVNERALMTNNTKWYLRTWYAKVWHFCQDKYDEDQNTKKTLGTFAVFEENCCRRIAVEEVVLLCLCGVSDESTKKIQTPSWSWTRFHVYHQFKPVLSIDKDLLSRVLLSNIDLIVLFQFIIEIG